jgi:hypothetical protein
MDEPDYLLLTSTQKKTLRHLHDHGSASRAVPTRLIGMTKPDADFELSDLIFRGAIKIDSVDHDLILLDSEAA